MILAVTTDHFHQPPPSPPPPPPSLSQSQQATAASDSRRSTHQLDCQTVRTPRSHVNPLYSLPLYLPLPPFLLSPASSSPWGTRAIDSPPVTINRDSPDPDDVRSSTRIVAVLRVPSHRDAVRDHAQEQTYARSDRRRSKRTRSAAAAVAVAGVAARHGKTLAASPASQPKPASLHCSLPPRLLLPPIRC